MLEFLWSGSSKPPRPGGGETTEGPTPPAGEYAGAQECTASASSESSEFVERATPASVGAAAEIAAGETPTADGCDLPTAFGLARRSGRQRGRRLVKPAEPTPPQGLGRRPRT
jgi:hypothetical protein